MVSQLTMDCLDIPVGHKPPSTRYQGSKYKLTTWIDHCLNDLGFQTALDAFGGTGCVAYMLKEMGKNVTYNDFLRFNYICGKALIENNHVRLSDADVDDLLVKYAGRDYDNFIARTFYDIFFTEQENAWLDVVCQNIAVMDNEYKQALAYYALFQSCIVKRPYNLFHRKNLYMRTADVERSFGNKATWDKPFDEHFRSFVREANLAVFDSGVPCEAKCQDALHLSGHYDLVYIDTPYVNAKGVAVDYLDFYHFLEGMLDYHNWNTRIDYEKKHRPLRGAKSLFSHSRTVTSAFRELFQRYADSILVVSYRSDGIPSEEELVRLLREVKSNVSVKHFGGYKYVLSTNSSSKEILLIGY